MQWVEETTSTVKAWRRYQRENYLGMEGVMGGGGTEVRKLEEGCGKGIGGIMGGGRNGGS